MASYRSYRTAYHSITAYHDLLDTTLYNTKVPSTQRNTFKHMYFRFKEEAQQDIDSSSEMVEVLTQQTEELRRNGAPRQGSIVEQVRLASESLSLI